MVEKGKLPKPGDGPPVELRRKSWFQVLTNAKDEDDYEIWTSVTGAEGGYEDTSLMCVESALCLALEYPSLPRTGGILTPAVAFGTTLIERLDRAGIRFRVVGSNAKVAIRSSL